jgi:hypothetical protein
VKRLQVFGRGDAHEQPRNFGWPFRGSTATEAGHERGGCDAGDEARERRRGAEDDGRAVCDARQVTPQSLPMRCVR